MGSLANPLKRLERSTLNFDGHLIKSEIHIPLIACLAAKAGPSGAEWCQAGPSGAERGRAVPSGAERTCPRRTTAVDGSGRLAIDQLTHSANAAAATCQARRGSDNQLSISADFCAE